MKQASSTAGHIKKLEWVIWLSQKDLNDLREGDWINLREEFYDFLHDVPIPSDYQKEMFYEETSPEQMRKVQGGLKRLLLQCVPDQRPAKNMIIGIRVDIKKATLWSIATDPDLTFRQKLDCEDIETAAQMRLASLLIMSGIRVDQIRTCPGTKCGRVFLLKRKPRSDREFYCSLKCSRLAATHRYRKRLGPEKKDSLKAKDKSRSERRYRKRLGLPVRTERRKGA